MDTSIKEDGLVKKEYFSHVSKFWGFFVDLSETRFARITNAFERHMSRERLGINFVVDQINFSSVVQKSNEAWGITRNFFVFLSVSDSQSGNISWFLTCYRIIQKSDISRFPNI